MITLITGAPGSGKSNALVSLLEELGKDRALFVNGIPELKIPHVELADLSTWPDAVPDGSVVIGDECQGTFRPRGPGQKVPEFVAKLETHRHRGLDFYLITQGPNLVDTNVRALVGRHVHLRDLGFLGRWWYEWPECADNCRTAWKNAPIKKRYKLDKQAQKKYKSASIHVKPIRSFPWMFVVMVLALVLVGVLTWKGYGAISAKMNPTSSAPAIAAGQAPAVSGLHAPGGGSSGPKTLDDRTDWIPRISHKPESAPAYDALRQVKVMPRVAGGMCTARGCRCVTQQGTDAGLTEKECRAWLASPPFDPYEAPKQEAKGEGASTPEKRPEAPSEPPPALTLFQGGERQVQKSSPTEKRS